MSPYEIGFVSRKELKPIRALADGDALPTACGVGRNLSSTKLLNSPQSGHFPDHFLSLSAAVLADVNRCGLFSHKLNVGKSVAPRFETIQAPPNFPYLYRTIYFNRLQNNHKINAILSGTPIV
jgi:hypothetical protein